MTLKINKLGTEEPILKAAMAADRFFFVADGTRLVGEDHPDAVALAVAPGHRLHPDMIRQFGIKDGKLAKGGENKALKGTSDKGA